MADEKKKNEEQKKENQRAQAEKLKSLSQEKDKQKDKTKKTTEALKERKAKKTAPAEQQEDKEDAAKAQQEKATATLTPEQYAEDQEEQAGAEGTTEAPPSTPSTARLSARKREALDKFRKGQETEKPEGNAAASDGENPSGEDAEAGSEPKKTDDTEEGIGEERKAIGTEEIRKATETLIKYKAGKANYDRTMVENEEWFRGRYWPLIRGKQPDEEVKPQPVSNYLFSMIAAKHGDMMDSFPQADVLPRAEDDEETAETLKEVIPVLLERNDYEAVYDQCAWDRVKHGTSCCGVFWDPDAEDGLGDVRITRADLLSLFWQPGVTDIQKSRNLFYVDLVDNEVLEERYPELEGKLGGALITTERYLYDDTVDTTDKTSVIDWYYKRRMGSKTVLHYCKYVNDTVLFASENEEQYKDGWYQDGKYPFVLSPLYPMEGTPCGFGLVSLAKDQQIYIDALDQNILLCAELSSNPRYWASEAAGVNLEEFKDLSQRIVTVQGTIDESRLRPIDTQPIPASVVNLRDIKITEMKEITNNRDFQQGQTSSGVNAASAIAALQEAGNKNSRDIIKGEYRAFQTICYMVIERLRQFYTMPRLFRVTDAQGATKYMQLGNEQLQGVPLPESYPGQNAREGIKTRKPIFDIEIVAEKKNPYSVLTNTQTAQELFAAGFFAPANAQASLAALEMMEADWVPGVRKVIQQNDQTNQMMVQMQAQLQAAQQTIAMADQQMQTSGGRGEGAKATTAQTQAHRQAAAMTGGGGL